MFTGKLITLMQSVATQFLSALAFSCVLHVSTRILSYFFISVNCLRMS